MQYAALTYYPLTFLQTEQTHIRQLLQELPDQGLLCLLMVIIISQLFAFNTPRIVYSVEKKIPIIDCITHLLLMTLHSERCLIGRYPIWFTDVFSKSYFHFINHLWNASCGSDFMC